MLLKKLQDGMEFAIVEGIHKKNWTSFK